MLRRRLFTVLAGLSLVLCVATAAPWVRSYRWYDSLEYVTVEPERFEGNVGLEAFTVQHVRHVGIGSGAGQVCFSRLGQYADTRAIKREFPDGGWLYSTGRYVPDQTAPPAPGAAGGNAAAELALRGSTGVRTAAGMGVVSGPADATPPARRRRTPLRIRGAMR